MVEIFWMQLNWSQEYRSRTGATSIRPRTDSPLSPSVGERVARIEVDGSDITDETVGTTTQNIPQDAIQEFQISQSSLDLSTELTSSGAVNVVTRTGTNSVHGDAYYGFRDHSLNANLPGGQDLPFQ